MNALSKYLVTLLSTFALVSVSNAAQQYVRLDGSAIVQLILYADANGSYKGDLAIGVSASDNPTVCAGAYTTRNDPAYGQVLQTAQLAYATGVNSRLLVESSDTWGASPTKFCRLLAIELI